MAILDRIFGRPATRVSSNPPLSWDEFQSYFTYGNTMYPLSGMTSYGQSPQQLIDTSYGGLGAQAYGGNGIIFACIAVRMAHFSEARFQFRQLRGGRPGDLFGKPELEILEHPEPNVDTGDMLTRALLDVDLAGNWLAVRVPGPGGKDMIKRLRPDWVDQIIGSNDGSGRNAIDATVVGYVYHPGGRHSGEDPVPLLAEEVCHFWEHPDPVNPYRGMSWVTPMVREVMADNAARDHKLKFFENGATSNLAVNVDPTKVTKDDFDEFVEKWRAKYEGVANAYKTLMLRGAADITVIGSNFEQIDFKIVQGAGETRIAAAAGVPPIIVGLSEGLQAATYSNYDQARRRFADGTLRPLWRKIAASLETLVPPPDNQSQLWYDDRDIAFLRIDQQQEATVLQGKASAMKTLIDAGYEPDSVTDAINSGDLTRLNHTGLPTVQVHPDGTIPTGNGTAPAGQTANGGGGGGSGGGPPGPVSVPAHTRQPPRPF